jgi:HK97 family phage prohead protease
VIISTAALARDGHILVPQGGRLDNYRANPIVLWSHDPDKPVANAETVDVGADQITARVRFAPLGISHKADEIRGLVKAGVVRAVSVGFDPVEMEPIDPKKPRGGQRIFVWELMEFSFVSVPSDTGAVVTARSIGDDMDIRAETDQDAPAAGEPAALPKTRQATAPAARGGKVVFKRGLYEVANLCYLFSELGWQVDMAKWEAAIEGDASKVPAMLAAVLADLGDALCAMTVEEVTEALAGREEEPEEDASDDVLVIEDRAHIQAAKTPAIRAFRRGFAQAKLRAGKTLSADTVETLRAARALHDEAMGLHRSAMGKHREGLKAIDDMMDRAGVSDPENEDTQTVQTSGGTGVDEGSEGQRVRPAPNRPWARLPAR